METCKWQPTAKESLSFDDSYECREAQWKDGDVCTFHAPREAKAKEEFEEAILAKIEREESDEKADFHDFRGYIFPDGFSTFSRTPTRKGKEFRKRVDFTCAKFGDEASFANVKFGDKASFFETKFGDKASFAGAKFGDESDFSFATFRNEVNFFGATFGDEANFFLTTFGDKVCFVYTTLGNEVDFQYATFGNEADFSHATFQGSARFEGTDKDKSNKCIFTGSVDFRGATFAKPDEVFFRSVNLSKARLTETGGLDEIQFIDVGWGAEPKRFDVIKNFFRRLGKGNLREAWKLYRREHAACGRGLSLYEEFSLGSNAALVAEAYRGLQKNYENKRYHRLADDFYAGAMEMERRQRPIWKRWPYTLYRFISIYGQSWWRPLRLAIEALMLATLIFWGTGFTARNCTEVLPLASHPTIESAFSALGDAALHSFSVVTFQRTHYGKDSDSRLFYVATYLETIFAPTLVAFFLLALKRRFRR